MKWLGTGFGLITLKTFDVLRTYQLAKELEALLPVQVELHFSGNEARRSDYSSRVSAGGKNRRGISQEGGAFDRCIPNIPSSCGGHA